MRKVVCLFFWSCCLSLGAQDLDIARNIVYVGGGRQGMTYLKYERILLQGDHAQSNVNAGYGSFPGEHDTPDDAPPHRIVTAEIVQLFGFQRFFVELGIEPAVHFFGDVTYIDLNGVAGLRYQVSRRGGLFAQLGYNPRLYRTFVSGIDVPFYAGIGIVF